MMMNDDTSGIPRSQFCYQQLGAPTILYRHSSDGDGWNHSSDGEEEVIIKDEDDNVEAMEYIPEVKETFHAEKPWRNNLYEFDLRKIDRHAEDVWKKTQNADRARLVHYFHRSIGRSILPETYDRRMHRHDTDTPYIMMDKDISMDPGRVNKMVQESLLKMEYSAERMHASPRAGYCTPFSLDDIKWCVGGETLTREDDATPKEIGVNVPNLQDNPFYYGNCLQILPCTCSACSRINRSTGTGGNINSEEDAHSNPWQNVPNKFLLYPKGQSLCVSAIQLPLSQASGAPTPIRGDVQTDVGGRVLQVQSCFDANNPNTIPKKTLSIVRTPRDCALISCESQRQYYGVYCTGSYKMERIKTVELCDGRGNTLEPIYIAAKKHNSTLSSGQGPIFATVSKGATEMVMGENGPTTIHYMNCDVNNFANMSTSRHNIENLASISQIEFSTMHPMVLWSAARSKSDHKLYEGKGFFRRPAIGFGHSLHSIDLRSNQASFIWSPSDDEFVCKGIHSVDNIVPDAAHSHSIYVSSSSAGGKLYHIDARMPARTICSWALSGICEDDKTMCLPSGVYGSGTILARPQQNQSGAVDLDPPILGTSKEPKSYGLHLYQNPEKIPNFQTKVLERVAHVGLDPVKNFATSSYFPIPSASDNIFTTGMAAFYTPLSSVLKGDDTVGHDQSNLALCIITSTSRGDLHSYTMLATPKGQKTKARIVQGGPLGACALPLPKSNIIEDKAEKLNSCKTAEVKYDLRWSLSDTYPDPSTPSASATIPNFQYYKAPPLLTFGDQMQLSSHTSPELCHFPPDMQIGNSSCIPPLRRPVATCRPGINDKIHSKKKKRYKVIRPSENLRKIIVKLRETRRRS